MFFFSCRLRCLPWTSCVQRDSASIPMGITLAALDDTIVSRVEPGSVGGGCGLREGDEVLSINGKATKDCTHADVLNMVRAETTFTMECKRFSDGSGRVDSWVEPDTDHIDVLTVTLTRANDHANFGFALGQDHSDGAGAPHVVEIVKANKPADGKLELGDELSKINGLSVAGLDHEAVVGQLKAGGVLSIELQVKRHKNAAFMKVRGADKRGCYGGGWSYNDFKHLTVSRASKDISYGFSVACCQDQKGQRRYQPHRIEVINAGGLADGILAVGDEVIEINGTIVQQISHQDVIAIIVASNTLNIAVQRRVKSPVQEVVLARGSATVPWGAPFETAETEEGAPIRHYVKSIKAAFR